MQDFKENLPLPNFFLCNKKRYYEDELEAMGLPADFLDNRTPDLTKFKSRDSFPDLNVTWQRATWNMSNFEIDWKAYEGIQHILL